jgi:hypothetical protein
MADPRLFERIRGRAPEEPDGATRRRELAAHLELLLTSYEEIFSGDAQVLAKLQSACVHITDAEQARWLKALKKQKSVAKARRVLHEQGAT